MTHQNKTPTSGPRRKAVANPGEPKPGTIEPSQPTTASEPWLTRRQLAKQFGWSSHRIDLITTRSAVPHDRVGRSTRYRLNSFLAALERKDDNEDTQQNEDDLASSNS
jgi:hypothetical protein